MGDAGNERTGIGAAYSTTVSNASKETYGRRFFAGERSCFVGDIWNFNVDDDDSAAEAGEDEYLS